MNQYPSPSRKRARWYDRLAWYCCKVDFAHMEQSPNADRIMYQGLGWSSLASAIIASISSGYGLFLITEQRMLAPLGIVVGLLMIWLFRYSIARKGIGDGTAAITLTELLTAIPQLGIILFLGSLLSLPMEYVVLKSEVDVEIYTQLSKQKDTIRTETREEFTEEQQSIRRSITKLEADIIRQQTKHDQLLYELSKMKEGVENTPKHLQTRISADGPSWYDQIEIIDRLEEQVSISEAQTKNGIQRIQYKIKREESKQRDLTAKINSLVESKISTLSEQHGFINSLPYLRQVGGPIRLFIKGLLCSILLSPFIFMMMLAKNTYWIFKTQPHSNEPDIKGDFL